MPHLHKSLSVVRKSTNRLDPDRMEQSLVECSKKAIGKTLGNRGWTAKKPVITSTDITGGYMNSATVHFHRYNERDRDFERTSEMQFQDIVRKFLSACRAHGWRSEVTATDSPDKPEVKEVSNGTGDFMGASSIIIPDNWRDYFAHIYDRDHQIGEVMSAIRTAKDTDMEVRSHPMLYGPPGCGKSEICLALERMLGDAVLKLDATSTTKAGAENLILERETIPPILILEELEKCHEANTSWLLGVMDDRAEIVKTNARVGSVRRRAPMLVICTVNNLQKFKDFQEGALNNRFNVPIYHPMPDAGLLRRILMREVKKIPGGKDSWVEPALRFALDVEKTFQARRIKAIIATGRDDLLSGKYQEARISMMKRQEEDKGRLQEFGETW